MDSNLLNSPQVGSSPVVLFHQFSTGSVPYSTGSILTFTPNKNNQQKYTSTFKTKSLPISRLISGENRHPKKSTVVSIFFVTSTRFLFGEMSNLANYANYAAYVFFKICFFWGKQITKKPPTGCRLQLWRTFGWHLGAKLWRNFRPFGV